MRLSDETLRGRTIIGADGKLVGEVTRIYLDGSAWTVESLHAKLRDEVADEIGATRTVFRAGEVSIPVQMIQSARDTVILSVSAAEPRDLVPRGGDAKSVT